MRCYAFRYVLSDWKESFNSTMTTHNYSLPDDLTFTKTIVQPGQGLNTPNEGKASIAYCCSSTETRTVPLGSTCQVTLQLQFSPTDHDLDEKLYEDLLPLNEETTLCVGFYASIIANYVHKCLITMKLNEICQLSFHYPYDMTLLSIQT